MINKNVVDPDPQGLWPRRDRSSLGHSSNRYDLAFGAQGALSEYGFIEEKSDSLPKAMSGMVPFSSKTLYPSGFAAPPLGTGNAGQAFRTTGNFIGMLLTIILNQSIMMDILQEWILIVMNVISVLIKVI